MKAPGRVLPIAKHGTTGYKKFGCRCYVCAWATSEYGIRQRLLKAQGRWEPYVDAGPAREHLLRLISQGRAQRQVAAAAGVTKSLVSRLLYGHGRGRPLARIRTQAAQAILALPADRPLATLPYRVPATGTVRRIQALCFLGWSMADQAAMLGRSAGGLRATLRFANVHRDHFRAVADLYDRLSWTPAPAGVIADRVRADARRRGWFSPAAWDEDMIDDPAAFPLVLPPIGPSVPGADELAIQHAAAGHTQPADLPYPSRMEWIRRMRDGGRSAREIGKQLGLADTSVLDIAKRGDYYAANIGQVAG